MKVLRTKFRKIPLEIEKAVLRMSDSIALESLLEHALYYLDQVKHFFWECKFANWSIEGLFSTDAEPASRNVDELEHQPKQPMLTGTQIGHT